MSKRKSREQIILAIFFILLSAMIVFPFLLMVSASFSSEADIAKYGYSIIPRTLTLDGYNYVFKNMNALLNAYGITFLYSVAAMVLGTLLMSMYAYPLTCREMKGQKFFSMFLYFTMLFGGGLVPSYILYTKFLHLSDTIWIYIITAIIQPFYVFMMRTFFNSVPKEIYESAKIDGGTEYTVFFRFVLPLSKPVLATVALYIFLNKWNDYMTSMLYINNQRLISLQYLLQRMLSDITILQNVTSMDQTQLMASMDIPSESVKMVMAVLVAGPALFVFPFFQKYFVKGLTVGSVKG